ncbi:MAG: hypothetical protein NZ602_06025 [Thermoguttaceae bacterium]|nr:hypothetical protein [Thermoguttaceae bacterium]MDW8038603.1 hypothetical protein [Thermoguttaceae bacterium]
MDESIGGQAAPGAWIKQTTAQWAVAFQRLQELLRLQRARLKELRTELASLQQAEPDEEKNSPEEDLGCGTERCQRAFGSSPSQATPSSGSEASEEASRDLQRLYELALEQIRHLEAENRQLLEQIEKYKRPKRSSPEEELENWEAFKRRVLESLEAEGTTAAEASGQACQSNRVQIEEVLARTEALLAAKDQELEALRHLLENQAANLGAVAVGAAAVGQLLDQDEIIRQQRETLQRLEAEWREKLRQAEVQLSIERAALARKQAELDEKLQEVEQLRAELVSGQMNTSHQKKTRGWRTLFGLPESPKK